MRLPDAVGVARVAVLIALVADDHSGRNPLAAEHQGQGGGEVFAVSLAVVRDEVLDRIEFGVALLPFQAIEELARLPEPAFE